MNFGQSHKYKYGEYTKEISFEILDLFYSEFGNLLDTAKGYHNATEYSTPSVVGHSDEIHSNYYGNSTKSMKLSLEASLNKLLTSYVGILYILWWDYTTSIPELLYALNYLVASGKVLRSCTWIPPGHNFRHSKPLERTVQQVIRKLTSLLVPCSSICAVVTAKKGDQPDHVPYVTLIIG
ncbi:hypothetical protein CORC01_00758 [Colletotrichum orchidophilum]|uniref:NADP-dependent oxidoreductase domain-containing protein n=1 Tax=Colletotrichum orchidophilum TaxID=1209926 RepID=A0A1G4BRH6_9PEZI|nr:uncharacterized protein CORC01_00758 [Colletotrichum orchidophilum]OHF03896.1 hypothetical protein CORC01_00758 [Colletotrichum orchidophilum]